MVIEINSENFKKEVIESKMPVLIDFFAEWCGPCQMLKPVFEKISKDYEGKLKFAKLDTDSCPEIAHEFGIQGIPCIVFAKSGKEVERIVGFTSESMLRSSIDGFLKG